MKEQEEENRKSISNLPDEILKLIISSIPLKEAARTSILSSSWKRLLEPIQINLDMTQDHVTSQEATQQMKKIISSFLSAYENSHQFLDLSLGQKEVFLKAIKGVDKELHLEFFEGKTDQEVFGLSIELPVIDNERFFSLKTVHLRSINRQAGNFLSALFSGCRILESLSLEKCSGLETLAIKAHGFLQNLTVLDCENMTCIAVSSAPSLRSFSYRGILPNIQLKDTLRLCNVVLNLKGGLGHNNEFDCEDVVSFLGSLKDIETLTLSGWLLEWLCTGGVIFDKLEFKFNKLKEFSWIDHSLNKHKRDSLSCFLNITPSLKKLFIKIDEEWSPKTMGSPSFHQYWHEPHLWEDYATVMSNASELKHLKMVEISGFKIKDDDNDEQILFSLMDLLIEKAIDLKRMTVRSPQDDLS